MKKTERELLFRESLIQAFGHFNLQLKVVQDMYRELLEFTSDGFDEELANMIHEGDEDLVKSILSDNEDPSLDIDMKVKLLLAYVSVFSPGREEMAELAELIKMGERSQLIIIDRDDNNVVYDSDEEKKKEEQAKKIGYH